MNINSKDKNNAQQQLPEIGKSEVHSRPLHWRGMGGGFFDLDRWQEIFETLKRNKLRTFLTAFGVFWGVFMLVALIGGGRGLKNLTSKNFDGMASNAAIIWTNRTSEAYKGFRKGRYWNINNRDIETIKRDVKGLDEISALLAAWNTQTDNVVRGEKKGTFTPQGVYANYNKIDGQKMMFGRFISAIDVAESRKVCFIGTHVYQTLFKPGENPVGQDIRLDGVFYTVIGVGDGGDNMNFTGNQKSELITIPFTTMQRIYNYGDDVHVLFALAKPNVEVAYVQQQIETILRTAHTIAPNDKQAVNAFNLQKIVGQINGLYLGINILALIVGLGTLIAGVIGVSNIMMVTVKERTQEIGIRRAIGAKPMNIMSQIMSESFILTAIAGFLGIAFAVLVLQLVDLGLSTDGGKTAVFQVTFFTAIAAAVIIVILGTLAGLGPAFRAMKIKPIEALRDE